MKTKHSFEHGGLTWVVTRVGPTTVKLDGPEDKDFLPAATQEILRQANRIAELEAEVEAGLRGQAEISAAAGAAHEKLEAKNSALSAHILDYEERANRLVMQLQEERAVLAAVVAPLLPLFRERDANRAERDASNAQMGAPPVMWPDTITLTAEFPVEALRALCNSTDGTAPFFRDAIAIAKGCHDYGGGHRGKPSEYEAFQHGISTVVAALNGALERGLADTQIAVLHGIGNSTKDKEGKE